MGDDRRAPEQLCAAERHEQGGHRRELGELRPCVAGDDEAAQRKQPQLAGEQVVRAERHRRHHVLVADPQAGQGAYREGRCEVGDDGQFGSGESADTHVHALRIGDVDKDDPGVTSEFAERTGR